MDHPLYPYHILFIANPNLTAEGKYVLFQVLRLFGSDAVNEQVKTLANQMGVTDKVVTAARDLLLELGYLISVPRIFKNDGGQKAGRPNIAFQISPKTLTELDQISKAHLKQEAVVLIHKQRIDSLLYQNAALRVKPKFMENKVSPIPTRRSGVFTSANRILLAILYCHADACGVVKGLGISKLARLVGMTSVRLESQLDKLAQMGYLLARESGVSGRHLFGRAAGSLFLNVFNDELGDHSNLATLILMQSNTIDQYNDHPWGWRIFHNKVYDSEFLLFDEHDPKGVARTSTAQDRTKLMRYSHSVIRGNFSKQGVFNVASVQHENGTPAVLTHLILAEAFSWTKDFHCFRLQDLFKDAPHAIFAHYLQLKLNEYASTLLTQHWVDLHFKSIPIHDNLVATITDEIYPILKRDKSDDWVSTPQIAEALGLFIYRISYEMAIQAKCLVMRTLEKHHDIRSSLSNASYALLPVSGKAALQFAVAIKLADRSLQERYIHVETDKLQHTLTSKHYTADMNSYTDLDALLLRFGYHTKIKL